MSDPDSSSGAAAVYAGHQPPTYDAPVSPDDAPALDSRVRRLYILAEASRVFAMVPAALSAVIPAITQYVAQTLGDLCALRLIDPTGTQLLPGHCAHPDPATQQLAEAMMRLPYGLEEGPMGLVARTGTPFLAPVIVNDALRAEVKAEYQPFLDQVRVHSMLIVPMRAHGQILGILSLTRETPGRPYTLDDQAMLQDLADRAALAVENATLHQQRQTTEAELRHVNAELEQRVAARTADLRAANAALEQENRERRRVEAALRRREELLLTVGRIAQIGGWEFDCVTGELSFSDQVYRIHDLPLGTALDVDMALSFYPPEARRVVGESFNSLLHGGPDYELELPFVSASGRQLWMWAQAQAEWQDGRVVRVRGTFQDITARKMAELALVQREQRYRAIWAATNDAMALSDADGLVLEANPAYFALYGYPEDAIVGQSFAAIFPPERRAQVEEEYRAAFQDAPDSARFESIVQCSDGTERSVESRVTFLVDQGRRVAMLSTIRDITERKAMEALLRTERDRFAQLLQGLSDLGECVIAGEGARLIYANDAFCRLSGYHRDELLALSSVAQLAVPALRADSEARLHQLEDGEALGPFEGGLRHKEGRIVPLEISSRIVTAGTQHQFLSVMRDITERRNTEVALRASEERFRRSVETLMDGFAIFSAVRDTDGTVRDFRYEYINEAGCRLNQRAYAEQIGRGLLELLPAHESSGLFQEYVEVVETGAPMVKESLQYDDVYGGGRLSRAFDLRAVKLGDGFAVTWRDITARLQAEAALRASEARLQASLAEKEVLLKEVHHRVKNNLQVIISLLRLQAQPLSDPALKDQFRDTQNRVRAMALVHEQLYGAADLSRIPFAPYVQQLVTGVLRSYTLGLGRVKLMLEIAHDLALMIDMAVPLGLILTELLSNSIKYAFPDQQPGVITVRAARLAGIMTLVVQDDGVGLPAELDLDQIHSLGLQLVQRLTAQLHGQLEVIRRPGTTFRLSLPLTTDDRRPTTENKQ